jgi:hypothetical protein
MGEASLASRRMRLFDSVTPRVFHRPLTNFLLIIGGAQNIKLKPTKDKKPGASDDASSDKVKGKSGAFRGFRGFM